MKIAVVIPCFKVKQHITNVLADIGPTVSRIYIVDDACPEQSGNWVKSHTTDHRVVVLYNEHNLGVGGAVMAGYRAALADGMDIIVKIDGDGQMDPRMIPNFIYPIEQRLADYTKGNRFFYIEKITAMPKMRIFGNAILSFMTKLSSGYWDTVDPTNGYTAIHKDVLHHLPLEKISERYFFETDILFRLNILGAVVIDIPMDACYGDEVSNLKIHKIIGEFLYKHVRNFSKRIFYNYYLRGMSIGSFELPAGLILLLFGSGYGIWKWCVALNLGKATPVGTVMLSALSILIGLQLLLAFFAQDISSVPKRSFQTLRYKQNASHHATDD